MNCLTNLNLIQNCMHFFKINFSPVPNSPRCITPPQKIQLKLSPPYLKMFEKFCKKYVRAKIMKIYLSPTINNYLPTSRQETGEKMHKNCINFHSHFIYVPLFLFFQLCSKHVINLRYWICHIFWKSRTCFMHARPQKTFKQRANYSNKLKWGTHYIVTRA